MRVIIVGGGITGLAAAHRLTELARERSLSLDLRLLEAGDRLGGVIATERRDGFVLEKGPDSFITDKPWALALARRLGLQEQVIGTGETHRRSFVVRCGRLMPVPEGFQLLAPSRFGPLITTPIFSWAGKMRMAMDLVIPPRRDGGDESLGEFVLRRLGREALERMAQPMIGGIYGADPMKLSLQTTLPRFLEMERKHGSVIRGLWARMKQASANPQSAHPSASRRVPGNPQSNEGVSGARYGLFVSFRDGMQALTDALAARLPEGCVSLNSHVDRLEKDGSGWRLSVSGGESMQADALVLALPAYGSAALLRDLDADLARLLEDIPYASAATISLCYRREDVPHPLDGFGFVVPRVEGLTLLGCTFTNVKWAHRAPEGAALLRAFLSEESMAGRDDAELERLVRADLKTLLGITAEPQFSLTWRGSRCMPQYQVGHLDRVEEIERRAAALPGLALAGNAYRGVGIPDSVHSGEQAAERVFSSTL
jgi:protoporphyrinogen/coproporphyrinogen III oxidase